GRARRRRVSRESRALPALRSHGSLRGAAGGASVRRRRRARDPRGRRELRSPKTGAVCGRRCAPGASAGFRGRRNQLEPGAPKPRKSSKGGIRAVAEEERFELPVPFGTAVFKTAALNHSATPPENQCSSEESLAAARLGKTKVRAA